MVPPEARDGVAEDHFVTSRGGLNPGSPRTIVPGYHFTPRGSPGASSPCSVIMWTARA